MNQVIDVDGSVRYLSALFSPEQSEDWFKFLFKEINWKHDEVIMFGKKIITSRKTAWYATENKPYTYSKIEKIPHAFTGILVALKEIVEKESLSKFNACLLNLYHSGEEGMGWHSDDEKSIMAGSTIATLSFGAERKCSFRHKKTGEKVNVVLGNGSLLLMENPTQTFWMHAIPKTKKVKNPRISLTFRNMI